jgi:hypothetical protein
LYNEVVYASYSSSNLFTPKSKRNLINFGEVKNSILHMRMQLHLAGSGEVKENQGKGLPSINTPTINYFTSGNYKNKLMKYVRTQMTLLDALVRKEE